MSDNSDIPADKLTKAYIKIRSERSLLSAEFKEKDGALVRQLDVLKKALLDYCDVHNVESVRTSEGLLDRRLNQTNVKQFLEENPDVMPKGLNIDVEHVISVRKK